VVAAEDLPALLCLAQFLYEPIPQHYDHIVIDEGQDWSPLQYRLLASLSNNGSMTIVGDIAQSIYSYRGVMSWNEVRNALQPFPVEIHSVSINYRSTEPIVQLANQVLKLRLKGEAVAAVAVRRDGPEPVFRKVSQPDDLAAEVAREVIALREHHATVAVIVKLPAEKEQLIRQLSAQGVAAKALELPGTYTERDLEGVLVVSAHEAKGLEFDAVVIADASETAYSTKTPFDGSVLYVALSRALHHLSILYTNQLTRYIPAPI
jgi:DNA helicase-2/ATP-dependent DNA helicase PcrA